MKTMRLIFSAAVPLVIAMAVGNVVGEEVAKTAPEAIVAKFAKLDRNGDKRLSVDEFRGSMGAAQEAVALRDFDLFDRDADDYLSLEEYWSLPTHPLEERGPLPDPLTAVVDQFVGILDQLFDNWDKEPTRTLPVNEFLGGFSKTLEEPITAQMQREADPDRDRKVTREEARRFVEIQAGVRRSDGKPLREANGRVCQHMNFQNADMNRDDRVTRAEFLERGYAGEKADEIFTTNDLDKDGHLSWEEWCRFRMVDPILDFRWHDKNLDGQLDPAEMTVATPDWIKISSKVAFPGFDTDQNGTLSLDEFRMTFQANPVAMWHAIISDPDSDGVLSRSEFAFQFDTLAVIRYVYFGMLDRNGDKVLDPQEFVFKTKTRGAFYSLNADGSDWKKLFAVEGFPSLGSPKVSRDGKWIAFDGHAAKEGLSGQTMFIADLDGGNLRKLGSGMMPTWSKDGSQLAYSSGGIRLINGDGKESKSVANGWGAQWSPDGKRILYYSGLNVMTLDVASQKSTVVYNARDNGYQQVYWNMTWSPDSQRICFKGLKTPDVEEVATVSIDPDKPQFKRHHTAKSISAGFTWHPDGNRIVFPMYCPERVVHQLYEFNPNTDDPVQLVKGQDPKSPNTSACWTPDGKRLIVIIGDY